MLILSGCTADDRTDGTVQYQDTSFTVPDAGEPTYETGLGPVVGIDEAHHNYHRVDGRYRSFAEVLRADGYRVGASTSVFSVDALNTLDVLVISNALAEEKEEEWSLPTPAAFTADEVEAAEAWIRRGGRLMLIADHMPMPGAAENLALAFGVVFHDGYAFNADSTHTMVFSKESGQLADHVVTRDEGGGEIPFVVTFTGQAFRILPRSSRTRSSCSPMIRTCFSPRGRGTSIRTHLGSREQGCYKAPWSSTAKAGSPSSVRRQPSPPKSRSGRPAPSHSG